ncbi:MAG: sulfoxide reductase heme-binding subunit YedZ [Burkholderiales bacterium]|nr:sulfoxide reductase heme-binding subunit YedZ [Burkholderiales bacterium]
MLRFDPGPRAVGALKAVIFVAALAPAARLAVAVAAFPEWLGTNPAEYITRSTGDWTLRFLLATLAVTPLRRLSGWHWLVRLRRMLGLFAYAYGVAHFASFVAFDHVFAVDEILKDIVKRPFITVGFAALVLMTPLALTSTNAMVRRLGGKRWAALHRLVYAIAVLGVVHFWMMVKRDVTEPAVYGLVLAVLLGYRVAVARGRARDAAAAQRAAPPVR